MATTMYDERIRALEKLVASLNMTIAGMLPTTGPPMAREPVLEDRGDYMTQLVEKDVIERWGAGKLYVDRQAAVATTEDELSIYPSKSIGGVDASRWVFVGGPLPMMGEDTKVVVPEFGRCGVYPILMGNGFSFFNGQLPMNCGAGGMQTTLRALMNASCVVVCCYAHPWTCWFELTLCAYAVGSGNANLYMIKQADFRADAFDGHTNDVFNLAGAPYRSYTLRQRMLEVYDMLNELRTRYRTLVKDERECDEYDGVKTVTRSFAAVVQTRGRGLVNAQTPMTSFVDRQTIARAMFGTKQTDIALCVRLVYLLGLYEGSRSEHGDVYDSLRGEAYAVVSGFIVCVQQWDGHRLEMKQHLRRLQAPMLFLYTMLRMSSVSMPTFVCVPAD